MVIADDTFITDLLDDLRKIRALAKVEIRDLEEVIVKCDRAIHAIEVKRPKRKPTVVSIKAGDGVVAGESIGEVIAS
jgi:hypothetical protein